MMKAKLLLADNSKTDLHKWGRTLRAEGYDVTDAASVGAAKKLLDQAEFDLAIVDLHMLHNDDHSDMSGLDLAKDYRHKLPVIILTGLATVKAAVRALERDGPAAPAVAFVDKKDGAEPLLRAIRKNIRPKVFVSHGHDSAVVTEVVRFLENGGVTAIVLREQPEQGAAVVEKFERYSNVQFAVILLTPDDEGAERGQPPRPRARQNVIFELGFFVGKLGRQRVAVLKAGGEDIELPSNFHGVLYREMDPGGGWKIWIAREMRVQEIEIDLRGS